MTRGTFSTVIVVVIGFIASACGGDMAKSSDIVNLRVLAIRADPPEVKAPEGTDIAVVSVDALVVGGQGAVTYDWSLCLVPGVLTEGVLCLDEDAEIPLGQGRSASVPIPSLESVMANVPAEFQGFTIDLSSGLPVQVQLTVGDESDRTVTAIKSVIVSEHQDPNQNPVLDGLSLDGVELVAGEVTDLPVGIEEFELVPLWSETATETYVDDEGLEQTEGLLFSWYTDDESTDFDKERSDERVPDNTLKPGSFEVDDEAVTRVITLWLVARDDRGGVAWLSRQLRIVRSE